MKSHTDLKQSKILAEILPLESADGTWEKVSICGAKVDIPEDMQYRHRGIPFSFFSGIGVPCWSLAALMNLLPSEFTEVGKYSTTKKYEIHIRKYKFTDDTDLHQIAYGNYKIYEDGSSSWKDMINTAEREELLDAVFDMIVWLKENGKI